jgi:hypothetical protein
MKEASKNDFFAYMLLQIWAVASPSQFLGVLFELAPWPTWPFALLALVSS